MLHRLGRETSLRCGTTFVLSFCVMTAKNVDGERNPRAQRKYGDNASGGLACVNVDTHKTIPVLRAVGDSI